MYSFISPNTLTIECRIIPSGGTTQFSNPFGTEQQLQNRKIVAIETISNQDGVNSPISTGNPIITPAVFNSSFLRLYTSSVFRPNPQAGGKPILERPEGLYYDLLPLCILRRVNNFDTTAADLTSSGRDLFRMRPTEISWTKSSVIIPNAVAIAQEFSAIFIIHYLDEGDDGSTYRMK